jgi:hypothetical protein
MTSICPLGVMTTVSGPMAVVIAETTSPVPTPGPKSWIKCVMHVPYSNTVAPPAADARAEAATAAADITTTDKMSTRSIRNAPTFPFFGGSVMAGRPGRQVTPEYRCWLPNVSSRAAARSIARD